MQILLKNIKIQILMRIVKLIVKEFSFIEPLIEFMKAETENFEII